MNRLAPFGADVQHAVFPDSANVMVLPCRCTIACEAHDKTALPESCPACGTTATAVVEAVWSRRHGGRVLVVMPCQRG